MWLFFPIYFSQQKTTGEQIVKALDVYYMFSKQLGHTVLARVLMTGCLPGFITQVNQVAPNCEATCCDIYREMLASKRVSLELYQSNE